jgi:hypothetical protein
MSDQHFVQLELTFWTIKSLVEVFNAIEAIKVISGNNRKFSQSKTESYFSVQSKV